MIRTRSTPLYREHTASINQSNSDGAAAQIRYIRQASNHILGMDQPVGVSMELDDPSAGDKYVSSVLSVPPDLHNDENHLTALHCLTL